MPKLVDRNKFLTAVQKMFGDIETITRSDVQKVCAKNKLDYPNWLVNDVSRRVSRGVYSLKETHVEKTKTVSAPVNTETAVAMAVAAVQLNQAAVVDLVPEKAKGYVPFGNFADVRQIVKSNKFYPMYITGLSGNGKTMMIEQVCAQEKREMVRVNITIETDEDDLIGGFRLVDGRTVWQNGPVIVAMERGAVLLLDEVDLGSNKMMCLQPVLEGKPIYLKKINKVITPMPGFNIIATANTKGKGSDDGRFIGTNVMNEAFLERFSITMEQEYPPAKTEQKILNNVLGTSGIADPNFTDKLVQWAEVIRKSFYEGAVSEIISTRRLVHICEAYAIFGQNREKAIQLCLNRFDVDTKNSFLDLYKKLDETINPIPEGTPTAQAPSDAEVAF
jgi:AAA domain (dynein-related subfamily)/CbbQ/NirQ/NorQ C-terminal